MMRLTTDLSMIGYHQLSNSTFTSILFDPTSPTIIALMYICIPFLLGLIGLLERKLKNFHNWLIKPDLWETACINCHVND